MPLDDKTAVAAAEQSSTSAPSNDAPLRVREAAELLGKRREQEAKAATAEDKTRERTRGANGKYAPAATESGPDSPGPDAAPTEASGETKETDPAELPSIEPPKSWDKTERDWFATLPPERQQSIAEREGKRDADYSRRVSEQTRLTQAAEALHQQAQQAQQQYQQALPTLLQTLQNQVAGEFSDLKSMDDVRKMANEDPFRYARWDAQQKQIQLVGQEVAATQQRMQQEQTANFTSWAAEQDKTFTETVKDFSDPVKAPKLREGIVKYLTEARGVPRETLPDLWNSPLFRDARMQGIVYDAYQWHQARTAAKDAVAKAPPAAQRPGTAPAKGAANDALIQQLEAKLDNPKMSTREQIATAAALLAAKRAGGKK